MDGLGMVEDAIRMAVVAGRLRAAIREHGPELRGLERLAAAYSERAAQCLSRARA